MSASKKVLLAATIVSAGYGLATLFGDPKITHFTWRHEPDATHSNPAVVAPATDSHHATAPGLWALGSAQLVPDTRPNETSERITSTGPTEETAKQSNHSIFGLADVAPPPVEEKSRRTRTSPSTSRANSGPRAKLRNEAPRPLVVDAAPPVTVKSLEPAPPASIDLADKYELLTATRQAVSDMPVTNFSAGRSSADRDSTAGYQAAIITPTGSDLIVPQPLQPIDDFAEPRTHIIIDGDSLAKLAGRYLDDPHRSDEIFELNRHLLADPELLPIGTEIEIPSRESQATSNGQLPQSLRLQNMSVHAAARGGLIPVRPVPSSASVMPRARLNSPLPIE